MTWPEAVQKMGAWYQQNVHVYKADAVTYGSCSLLGGQGTRYDCTGFVAACLQYFGILPKKFWISSEMGADPNGIFAKKCAAGGFKIMQYSYNNLQPYDIVTVFEGRSKGQQHHAEIYAGKQNGRDIAYGWGNVHDGQNGHAGMPCKYNKMRYRLIFRYDGVARDLPAGFDPGNGLGAGADGTYSGGGGGGGGTFVINLDDYQEPYPVHSEYETYTGTAKKNLFGDSKSEKNAFNMAVVSNKVEQAHIAGFLSSDHRYETGQILTDASTKEQYKEQLEKTRIYSTNDSKIVLDQLVIKPDGLTKEDRERPEDEEFANKGISDKDVEEWKK